MDKILLIQINIYENLCGAYFVSDEGDVLVSHNGKLSLIRQFHFGISLNQIEQIDKKLEQQDRTIVNMDEFYSTQKYRVFQNSQRMNQSSRLMRNVSFVEEDLKNYVHHNTNQLNNSSASIQNTSGLFINLTQTQMNTSVNNNPNTATHMNGTGNNNIQNFNSMNNNPHFHAKKQNRQAHSLTKGGEDLNQRGTLLTNSNKRLHSVSMVDEKDSDYQKAMMLTQGGVQTKFRTSILINEPQKTLQDEQEKRNNRENSYGDMQNGNVRRSNNFQEQQQKNIFTNNSNSHNINRSNVQTPKYQLNTPTNVQPHSQQNSYQERQKKSKPMTVVEQQYVQKMQSEQQSLTANQKQQQKQVQNKVITFVDSDNSQINNYKKITALPKIGPQSHRPLTIIEKFTNIFGLLNTISNKLQQEKLLSKKVLTRRDITLNKIIMRNLVRNQQAIQAVYETQVVQGMKMNNDSSFISKSDKNNLSFMDRK